MISAAFWLWAGGGAAALLAREAYRKRALILSALRGDYEGPERGE